MAIGLESAAMEFGTAEVLRNAATAILYEHAIAREQAAILACGALATYSGEKTGRSPLDKRIVDNPESSNEVWWGNVNIPAGDAELLACRQQALDYLGARPMVYVVDGFAGWDPHYRIKVRVVCSRRLSRAVHA